MNLQTAKQAPNTTDAQVNGTILYDVNIRAVLVTGEEDLANLTDYYPGSIAYTAGFDKQWQLGADNEWIEITKGSPAPEPSQNVTETVGVLDVVDSQGVVTRNVPSKSVMVTAQSDLANLTGYEPGTIAYTAGFKGMWQLSAAGTWVNMME